MKKSAWWMIVVMMLSPGTVWAQEPVPDDPLVREVCSSFPFADSEMCAPYRPVKTTRDAHPKLEAVGWTMVILGAAAMIPAGTTYHVLGDAYCVTEYAVDEGRCSTPRLQMQILAAVIGTGFVLAKIGGRQVAINPTVSPNVVGASASIQWGGPSNATPRR